MTCALLKGSKEAQRLDLLNVSITLTPQEAGFLWGVLAQLDVFHHDEDMVDRMKRQLLDKIDGALNGN